MKVILTIVVVFNLLLSMNDLNAQCGNIKSDSLTNRLENTFCKTAFKIYRTKQNIDSVYLKCYQALFNQTFDIANTNELYNETDLAVNSFPYRRLVSHGKDVSGKLFFILYEMDQGLYLEIFEKDYNQISSFLSYQLPLEVRKKSIEAIKRTISKKKYFSKVYSPFKPLYNNEERPPPKRPQKILSN